MGGGTASDLAAQMKRDGVSLPDNIATQPKLASNLVGYLDAFYDLDTERSHNNGLTRIPWSAVHQYGLYHLYNMDELHFFIRQMDDALLDQMAQRIKGGSSGSSTVVQRPPRPD